MNVKVIKRDKSQEEFDPEKIVRVVKVCGLDQAGAEKLVKSVGDWLKTSNISEITSLQLRDRVLVEIQKADAAAAKKFIWYEKYKDKNYGVKY